MPALNINNYCNKNAFNRIKKVINIDMFLNWCYNYIKLKIWENM